MGVALESADAVRAADPARALRLYVEARDAIDPCDADRVGWLAEHGAREEALIPLFRETVRLSGGALRWSAAYALGHLVDLLEEPAEAAPALAIVVREAHDVDPVRWLRACVNLAQCYRLLGRPFECLVLARRAERRAAALGEARIRAIACLHLTGVLCDLRDTARMTEALCTGKEALDAAGDVLDPVLAVLFVGYRAQLRSLEDDLDGAEDDFDALLEGFGGAAGTEA